MKTTPHVSSEVIRRRMGAAKRRGGRFHIRLVDTRIGWMF